MSETTGQVRLFEQVCEILDEHNRDASKLIPILHSIQAKYRYLPEEVLSYVATSLKISPAKVYGVASFYSHFTLEPKGKYVIRICDGTACHVKNSTGILEAMREQATLHGNKSTTDDMLFTVETVSCLGACGLAPVILVNENVHGQVGPSKAVSIIKDLQQKEALK